MTRTDRRKSDRTILPIVTPEDRLAQVNRQIASLKMLRETPSVRSQLARREAERRELLKSCPNAQAVAV